MADFNSVSTIFQHFELFMLKARTFDLPNCLKIVGPIIDSGCHIVRNRRSIAATAGFLVYLMLNIV